MNHKLEHALDLSRRGEDTPSYLAPRRPEFCLPQARHLPSSARMWHNVLLLIVGLALIIKGGDWFVGASVRIAEFLNMPRVVIGSTLVSLATTSPEMVVSIMSGLHHESGLAIGNAVGSCICNIGLILGLMAALKQIDVHPKELRTPLMAMFAGGVVLLLFTLDLTLSRWQGAVLLLAGLGYFAYDFRRHHDVDAEDIAEARAIEEEHVQRYAWLRSKAGTAAQFAAGAAIVVLGSKLLVDSAVAIATALGISSLVIGLTVVAIGTSLPELVTAITSSRQNVSDLAVGNILGANIANLTLVVGSAASLHPVSMMRATQVFNFPALLAGMGLMLYVLVSGNRITRREGAALLSFYGLYLVALVTITVLARK